MQCTVGRGVSINALAARPGALCATHRAFSGSAVRGQQRAALRRRYARAHLRAVESMQAEAVLAESRQETDEGPEEEIDAGQCC